jgi:hypothetical protein
MARSDQSPDALLKALTDVRVPVENHYSIRRIVRTIGIAEYRSTAGRQGIHQGHPTR